MRYFVGFVCVLALAAVPLSVSAQQKEEGATPEPDQQEPARMDESSDDEGGLSPRLRKRTQRNWDPTAYDIHYTSKPEKPGRTPRAKKSRNPALAPGIGLGVSMGCFIGGLAMVGVGASQAFCISFGEPCETPRSSPALIGTGAVLTVGGLIGIIVSGIELRNSDRRGSKAPSHRSARRVQWDSGTSRLVF
ncbi:MAG: hypothetical protein WBM96_19455 [Polyangiales bacterium]